MGEINGEPTGNVSGQLFGPVDKGQRTQGHSEIDFFFVQEGQSRTEKEVSRSHTKALRKPFMDGKSQFGVS